MLIEQQDAVKRCNVTNQHRYRQMTEETSVGSMMNFDDNNYMLNQSLINKSCSLRRKKLNKIKLNRINLNNG